MKLDILAIAAHPDDVELSAGGTLAKHARMGYQTGIVDLTKGELGTRGTPEIRAKESAASAEILGLSMRDQLDLGDGFFENSKQEQLAIIRVLRKYQPDMVLCNAPEDRHPDHGKGGGLARDAAFLSGLQKICTYDEHGQEQEAWRPKKVLHYIQDRWLKPDVVVDISDDFDTKMKAIRAFKSQFFDPNSKEPETYISKPVFLDYLEARALEMGHGIAVRYGEGFLLSTPVPVADLTAML